MTTMRHRAFISVAVVATALSVLTGCTRSVGANAVKAGAGDVPRNNNSEQQYPNLLSLSSSTTVRIFSTSP
jgi:hypothetical protein